MTEPRDSFARQTARRAHTAVKELGEDMNSLWVRVGVVERKTAGLSRVGQCGLCGEPAKARYCEQCLPYWEGETE